MKKNGVMLVGLCGRSGSGKGYIAKMFDENGIPSIDTDAVYRNMTGPLPSLSECSDSETHEPVFSPCMSELINRFGNQIISPDGSLNRKVMRNLVFGEDRAALSDLNRITHRHILKETVEMADSLYNSGSKIVLIDAPVLYESGFDKFCDAVVCVTAPEDIIVKRIMERDKLTSEEARRRLDAQKPVCELEALADYVITNVGERPELYKQVCDCIVFLKKLRAERYD